MQKNQIIIIIVVVLLVFAGLTGWFLMQKDKISENGENGQEQEEGEVFSLSAIVQSSDIANNFLTVKPINQENEVKVVLSETTKLIKLEFPFDPANPPEGATFAPIQTEIEIADFKEGDNIFIKSRENITDKTEISSIDFIHILP